ncbi:hypothetical protein [Roseiarcus fermentans]|uniref:hypothetical protein n=1 Tax=Roseiarcus fermentans TaxID=1473586 RepID=UPI0011BF0F33|nr:hypothetical protein [Roseiarcus fermentans]
MTIVVTQSGSNVVATGSGTLDLAGLTKGATTQGKAAVYSSSLLSVLTVGPTTATSERGYSGATVLASFGNGGSHLANAGSGDGFGIAAGEIYVPSSFASGGSLSGSATWSGETLADLGLTPGTYVSSWASDEITVDVSAPAPEFSTWAMMLAGFGGLTLAGRRASRKAIAVAA